MALIGTEKIPHRILRVSGGGESLTLIEGGGDRWIVEPGKTNVGEIYSTVIEQLALQGYKIVSIAEGVTTLQLDAQQSGEDAGRTSLYILRRAGVQAEPMSSAQDANFLTSLGLPDLSSTQAESIISLLKMGRKIEAIKAIREAKPSLGLKDAKELADSLQHSLGIEAKKTSGCLGAVVFLIIGVPILVKHLV